ncbi:pentatricopeptide repeat-containing protein At5g15340, mitochondrial-like [Telopea speciosissima]|uniref:pentatricopeptide repeat-containing protein At5g15340, mitochondrial-like n=1 Tax=Telopea speciosissima TaxID=54955 RepID=UPI001CC6522E|nr:pentatricopeptide repeat-containing protein At5g15340, mitochondrial-like [Telopea speciosissima]
MPIPLNEVVLGSLLASCILHGKLQLGKHLLQELIQIDPCNTDYHVLQSNMYTLAGRHDNADFLCQVLQKWGIKKVPGISSIHVNAQVHQFTLRDKSHPQTQEIYSMLDVMIQQLRFAGYVPNTASQAFSVSENQINDADEQEEKEHVLFSHSEKLAISFGLISTKPK